MSSATDLLTAPVLDDACRHDEAHSLQRHDLVALRLRLDRALRRRRFVLPALWSTAVAVAIAVAGVVAGGPPTTDDPLTTGALQVTVTAPTLMTTTTTTSSSTTSTTSTTPAAAPVETLPPSAPASPPRVASARATPPPGPPASTAPPANEAPAVLDVRVIEETSRLRAALQAIADAAGALAIVRALRRAQDDGPLDIDAALLAVRCLTALGRNDEARAALAEADAHPHAAQKRAALATLQAALDREDASAVDDEADDDDGPPRRATP